MLVFPLGPAHSNLVADGIQFLCNDLNRRGVGCTWSKILEQREGARWRTNLTVTDTLNPNGGVVSLELAWSPPKLGSIVSFGLNLESVLPGAFEATTPILRSRGSQYTLP